ncbi:MAG: Fic family protein [Spirochaetota bacterium]|jgi:Fic family protein|nr:Fic family protein [Spirochaetota bacterium]
MINMQNVKITQQMLAIIAELDEFKGTWTGAYMLPEQRTELKKVSTIESVGSSNRIEGNTLSNKEVEELLSRMQKKSFQSRDEEEVAGYAELMDIVFDDYSVIPLTENYIKQLHQTLLRYVGKDEKHRGEYKKLPNQVAAFDPDGMEIGIVFATATPFDTPRLMEELAEWTRKNLDDPFLHPLIVIGIFVVHFLAIHPFQDGNGRLSRALTTMLLLKKGYAYMPYSSLEAIIETSKEGYYRALQRTQKGIWGNKVNYEPWLAFFLTALQKQKRHLESKIGTLASGVSGMTRNQRAILELFNDAPELASSEIAARLNMNIETVKKNLKSLTAHGFLRKHGATKGAWYTKG